MSWTFGNSPRVKNINSETCSFVSPAISLFQSMAEPATAQLEGAPGIQSFDKMDQLRSIKWIVPSQCLLCDEFWDLCVILQEFGGDFHKSNHHLWEVRQHQDAPNVRIITSQIKSSGSEWFLFVRGKLFSPFLVIYSPTQHSQELSVDTQHPEPLTTDCQWQTICQCGQDQCFRTVTGDTSLLTNLSQPRCSQEQLDEIWHEFTSVVHQSLKKHKRKLCCTTS